jgi:hypothetical protein
VPFVGFLGDRVMHSFLFYVCVVHISVFVQNSVFKEKSGEDNEPWYDVMVSERITC